MGEDASLLWFILAVFHTCKLNWNKLAVNINNHAFDFFKG